MSSEELNSARLAKTEQLFTKYFFGNVKPLKAVHYANVSNSNICSKLISLVLAMVAAQLAKRLLPIPEACSSNPIIG